MNGYPADLLEKIVAAIVRGVSKQAARRTRAALPIEGQIWLTQRYAVDYEQLGTLKPRLCLRARRHSFGPEHLILLIAVSSAGLFWGAGVWDAQEEEERDHHSHGYGAHSDSERRTRPESPKHPQK